ncbi:MAG: hypothetical protein ACK5F0_06655 [Flavobacteriales bacterium]|jgi:voltage-gated potassium channel
MKKNNVYTRFKNLPFCEIPDEDAKNKTSTLNLIQRIIIDILDDDIWGSKISVIGNTLLIAAILTTTIDYILSNGSIGFIITNSVLIHLFTLFFLVEYIFRIAYSSYLGFSAPSKIKYIFSFMGLIDLLGLIPMIMDVFSLPILSSIGALRILRLWRVVRYIPSFKMISSAFHAKKDDILTSLIGIILLSLTLSSLIFHFESSQGHSSFKSILEVFVWSIGKYTGDYGSIALNTPISPMAKVVATINGLLGIALFALPAGLMASAFIEQLEEKRKYKIINERIQKIEKYFAQFSGGGKHFQYKAHPRWISIDNAQSKFLLSEGELFECIREARSLRFRALKSSPEMKVSDLRIIESFKLNCTYGYRQFRRKRKIVLINANGNIGRGISHLSYTLAHSLDLNYLSMEVEVLNEKGARIGGNSSQAYEQYLENRVENLNPTVKEFLEDLDSYDDSYFFVVLSSAASGRNDIVLEYGNDINSNEWVAGKTTLKSEQVLNQVNSLISNGLSEIKYTGANQVTLAENLNLELNTIGLNKKNSLHRLIHERTKANVISLYVNINILTGESNLYYFTITALGNIIENIEQFQSLNTRKNQ